MNKSVFSIDLIKIGNQRWQNCGYAPISYILPSRLRKYEELYDTEKFRQVDRETALKALMTTNLLKRLESSVESFRLTLETLEAFLTATFIHGGIGL